MSSTALDACFLDPMDGAIQRRWQGLLDRSAQATPFSTLAFADAVRDVFGFSYRLAGVERHDQLIAGILVFERTLGPYRLAVVPPLTPYTSFLFDPPLRETDIHEYRSPLTALLPLLDAHYHALCFHLHPSLTDVRAFTWAGYRARPLYTYHRQLADENTLLREVSKGVRKRYTRHAEAYTVTDGAAASALAGLVEDSYDRQGRSTGITVAQRTAFIERLRAAGLARCFVATPRKADTPEGGQAILHHGTDAFALTAGSRPGPAMTLLLVEIMLMLRADGVQGLDLVGANTPSIAEFKRSFGPTLVPYFRVERFVRPELRLLHAIRPLF